MTHAERAGYLRAIGAELRRRSDDISQIWPRQSGVLYAIARFGGVGAQGTFNAFADLAGTFPFEEPAKPEAGEFGLIVREAVGVVGAIIPWNAPMALISNKVAPALLAGCSVVLKSSPEAPGEGYLIAEAAKAGGLPPGVLNVLRASSASQANERDTARYTRRKSTSAKDRSPAQMLRTSSGTRQGTGVGARLE